MGQSWLLPPSFGDLIPVDHICYLVIAIVNGIEVSEIEKKYSTGSNRAILRIHGGCSLDCWYRRLSMACGLRERLTSWRTRTWSTCTWRETRSPTFGRSVTSDRRTKS